MLTELLSHDWLAVTEAAGVEQSDVFIGRFLFKLKHCCSKAIKVLFANFS